MAANLDLFHMHLHRQPNTNTKLDLQSPIINHDKTTSNAKLHKVINNSLEQNKENQYHEGGLENNETLIIRK